jgi:protein-tyrosine phosphatase
MTRGYDLDALRARQIQPRDFETFDLILAMDKGHYNHLIRSCPESERYKVRLFLDFSPHFPKQSVPDPYYGEWDGFISVLDMIEDGCNGLMTYIETELLD